MHTFEEFKICCPVSIHLGRVLLYNSMLILVLVLRYTITVMRELGIGSLLPLDNNIYLHKVVGYLIFVQATVHTVMHLCNFAINVQPDPLRFVQLTTEYWEEFGDAPVGWMNLPYHPPPGCEVKNTTPPCPPGSLDPSIGVTYCQICPGEAEPWSYYDWIMTARPHLFGLIPGWANPTGVVLMAIICIMVICSMPFVRRGGYFEVCILYRTAILCHAFDASCLFSHPIGRFLALLPFY